jgi:hypothetical protein
MAYHHVQSLLVPPGPVDSTLDNGATVSARHGGLRPQRWLKGKAERAAAIESGSGTLLDLPIDVVRPTHAEPANARPSSVRSPSDWMRRAEA